MTRQDLQDIGFKPYKNPFDGGHEYFIYVWGGEEIIYKWASKLCTYAHSEYSIIQRECRTSEEVEKFVECIKFLYE